GTGTGTGVIAVRGLTAVHPGADHAAVAAVDLDLRPGRTVAVVGESGSGKTTLARVLVRFVEIAGGTVTLDGVDVRDLDPDEVRRHVTLTGQDGHLFATSVRDNVRLARPDADDAVVRDALARVGLTAWVDALPEGLDTEVGDDGARVSGGQHRRLLVARALVQGAPVLVADEPTAHLDTPTADAVLADLLGAASDRGLLLLTHRLDGLGDVDEIVVLDRGRVVERGRHHDLLAAGGAYHRLWTDQHPTPTPTPTAGLC
ncbi:MAG TPA: ABC transporter ATP-binding protein, partial [Acidimicrobiales bacterium]|nr:ABC transporter ATP-binding protein [Acidimicrobiales bacterium]